MFIQRNDLVTKFVSKILNNNDAQHNACVYDQEFYTNAIIQKVVFYRNHKEQYKKFLMFCAMNDLIVLTTQSATYAVTVRIENRKQLQYLKDDFNIGDTNS